MIKSGQLARSQFCALLGVARLVLTRPGGVLLEEESGKQPAIVHWVYIRRILSPLVLCDEIWTVGLQHVPCAACRVCWHTILLEDESGGQPAIALKNHNLVIIYEQYKLLFIKTSL